MFVYQRVKVQEAINLNRIEWSISSKIFYHCHVHRFCKNPFVISLRNTKILNDPSHIWKETQNKSQQLFTQKTFFRSSHYRKKLKTQYKNQKKNYQKSKHTRTKHQANNLLLERQNMCRRIRYSRGVDSHGPFLEYQFPDEGRTPSKSRSGWLHTHPGYIFHIIFSAVNLKFYQVLCEPHAPTSNWHFGIGREHIAEALLLYLHGILRQCRPPPERERVHGSAVQGYYCK